MFDKDCRYWFPYNPVNPMDSLWGRPKFLPLEELHKSSRGFLVNDQIYIGVEISIVSTTEYLWCALMDSIKTRRMNSSCWTYLPVIYSAILWCVFRYQWMIQTCMFIQNNKISDGSNRLIVLNVTITFNRIRCCKFSYGEECMLVYKYYLSCL